MKPSLNVCLALLGQPLGPSGSHPTLAPDLCYPGEFVRESPSQGPVLPFPRGSQIHRPPWPPRVQMLSILSLHGRPENLDHHRGLVLETGEATAGPEAPERMVQRPHSP